MLAAPLNAKLPRDIVKIVNLRYVRANLSTCKGVGKLTSLQELSSIYVCEGDNIRELGDIQKLRGKLRIQGLENVEKLEDDLGALMEKQTRLDELELVFNQHSAKSSISARVLDALKCPPNLTYLKIVGYTGVKSPSWMVDRKHKFDKLQTLKLSDYPKLESLPPLGEFDKLQTLELSNCPELESLPPLGELTSLKHLSLRKVGVKRLGHEFYGKFSESKVFFPSLESLCFHNMEEWEEWDDIIIENSSVSFFPHMTRLKINHCPKLESLPPLKEFDKLQTLQLFGCPELDSLPPLGELTSLKFLSLSSLYRVKRLGDQFYGKFTKDKVFFPSLESLEFSFMREWEEWNDIIIEHSSMSFFPRLTRLHLSYCPKLESLPPLGELTSLNDLYLWDVGVKRLGDEFYGKFTDGKVFFPSLESLRFSFMQEWEEWNGIIIENSSVSLFPRLTELKLSCCPKLESLPPLGELTSLKRLYLINVGVKRLGDEFYGKFTDGKVFFPSLKSLDFDDMQEWEEWDDIIIIENSSVSFFPRLTELKIYGCPKLVSVLPVVKNPIMNATNFMTSLSRLVIWYCDGLRSLPADGLPPSLRNLQIKGCPLLYERCRDESGSDWHKINHIPNKEIHS